MTTAPRPADHLRVLGVLGWTFLALLPALVWVPLSPILRPLVRARFRRRLRKGAAAAALREGEEPPPPDRARWGGREVFVVAGEASGDQLAARAVRGLLAACPELRVRGYAGPRTEEAGARLERNLVDHAVLGVSAVLRSFGFWWRVLAETSARFRERRPDLVLTVDFPGLNARIARFARARGIPSVHLVAPAVWAYMPWRVFRWRRAVDRLLATFPFEAPLLEGSGVPTTFVGHPLFETPLAPPRTPSTWPGAGPCRVELLPGSRRQEILHHAPVLAEAAARIRARLPRVTFEVRLAEPGHEAIFREAAERAGADLSSWRIVVGEAHDAGAGPALPLLGAVASSGTVTAELGAALVPMAVFYRLSPLGRLGAWVGLTAPWIGLVNLTAGEEVVPERLIVRHRGRRLADDFLSVAGEAEAWARTRRLLDERVRQRLGRANVRDRIAAAVLGAAGAP